LTWLLDGVGERGGEWERVALAGDLRITMPLVWFNPAQLAPYGSHAQEFTAPLRRALVELWRAYTAWTHTLGTFVLGRYTVGHTLRGHLMNAAVLLAGLVLAADAATFPLSAWSFVCKVTSGSISIIEDGVMTKTTSDSLDGTFVYEHFEEEKRGAPLTTALARTGTAVLVVSGVVDAEGTPRRATSETVHWELGQNGSLHIFEAPPLGNLVADTIFAGQRLRPGQVVPYAVSFHVDYGVSADQKRRQTVSHYVGRCVVSPP
jgi:hypothetical protein